ncbi:MAG: hypothetical protein E6H09_11910 [Bacteroidetes bacterium]|jgi:hypothetical protein|nr:MAG: hypothetical protein E6H09_11910 [Bacteroidota bacterium]
MSIPKSPFGNITHLCLLLFLLAITLINCKKADQIVEKTSATARESKFFTNHTPADPLIKSVLGFVKRENEKHQFVNELIKKIGYPYWDKAIVAPRRAGANSRVDSDSTNTIFIPFVLDSAKTVNTTLIVETSPSDTNFLLIADWQYKSRPYASPSVDSAAENVALLFIMQDRNVFGYDRFTITDSNLFRSLQNSNSAGREIRVGNSGGRLGSQQRVSLDYEVEVCFNTYVCPWPDYCGPHGGCDYMNCVSSTNPCYLVSSICWTYYYDIGSGEWSESGDGGPAGGGSGGGWNNWEPPVCEEPTGGRVNQYEDCGPGWTPPGIDVPIEAENPCDATDANSGAQATLQFIGLKPTVQQFTAFDPNVTNQAEQYFLVNESNGSNVPGPIQTLPTTGGSLQGVTSNTVMVVHTHPFGGFPSPSVADCFGLGNFGSNFQMNYVIAFNGSKYAIVISSYSQLQSFVAANPGAISTNGQVNLSSAFGARWAVIVATLGDQGYTEADAYERATAYLMKKEAGVTMVKANSGSDTFKKIGLKAKMQNGVPVVNSYGDPLFENADCS